MAKPTGLEVNVDNLLLFHFLSWIVLMMEHTSHFTQGERPCPQGCIGRPRCPLRQAKMKTPTRTTLTL
jgi:hypothetical protein